jgi:hypothetical protein
MRATRPKPRIIPISPPLLPPLDWTETAAYAKARAETERMCRIEALREAELIREAEHEAELRYLRKLARLKTSSGPA